jgi:bacterioferritin (cytochrome b1)
VPVVPLVPDVPGCCCVPVPVCVPLWPVWPLVVPVWPLPVACPYTVPTVNRPNPLASAAETNHFLNLIDPSCSIAHAHAVPRSEICGACDAKPGAMTIPLVAKNAAQVLDVLAARLTFERTGVKLYDSVIQKIERSGESRYHALVATLRKHRNEEKEHEEWLEQVIRALGGHPEETTTLAMLETEESQGIQSVILDGHTRVIEVLHALLTAELADNAGWDLLVELADDTGDRLAKAEFGKRMHEEARHLAFLREAVLRAAEVEILGRDEPMPKRPISAVARPLLTSLAIGGIAVGLLSVASFLLGRRFG